MCYDLVGRQAHDDYRAPRTTRSTSCKTCASRRTVADQLVAVQEEMRRDLSQRLAKQRETYDQLLEEKTLSKHKSSRSQVSNCLTAASHAVWWRWSAHLQDLTWPGLSGSVFVLVGKRYARWRNLRMCNDLESRTFSKRLATVTATCTSTFPD